MRASRAGPSGEAEGGTLYIRFVRRGVREGARESTMIAVDERLAAESSGWVRSSLLAPGAGACGPAAQPLLTFVSAYEHLTPHALEQVFEAARAIDLLGRLDKTERALLGQQRCPAESLSDTDAASLHSERQSLMLQLPAELALGRATRLREQVHTIAMACAVGADAVCDMGTALLSLRFAQLTELPDWPQLQCALPPRTFLVMLRGVPEVNALIPANWR